VVRVEAKAFKTAELGVVVRVGVISAGDVVLQAGAEKEITPIPEAEAVVNSEQGTVQGILTASPMDTLPISGRNFLDLAQLTPGVQFQDGSIFHPSKSGFSSVSFEGRLGRAARIEVDGVDISDETVGTTAWNIPASAIQEFNLAQSTLDLPTELTSSGAVLVSTRSGDDTLHGEALGFFRGNQTAASLPGPATSFQREQFAARLGGALIKDKLFGFLAAERTKQDLTAPQSFPVPFNTLSAPLSQPFRELQTDGRLDWQRPSGAHAFYRFDFDQTSEVRPFRSDGVSQAFRGATHTPSHTLGYDFSTGPNTHSIRFEYLRVRSGIGDDTAAIPAGVNNPIPGLGISVGAPVEGNCGLSGGGAYCGGAGSSAPQLTFQSNYEGRYDGSRIRGNHVFRYGVTLDRIQAGGFAALYMYPQVGAASVCLPGSIVLNCITSLDPTAYPADSVFLGNGLGFSTAASAFGYPGGGLGPDNRIEAYIGDNWKAERNLTVTYGIRYVRETGRVDSSLGGLSELNQWQPGLGATVHNPNKDFAPQLGFAWNFEGKGKTVIRGGGGLYYASTLWSNTLLDGRARTRQGLISYTPQVCAFGNATAFTWPSSLASLPVDSPIAGGAGIVSNPSANQVEPTFCGAAISAAGSEILALSNAFQAAAAGNVGSQPNPNYTGTSLSALNGEGAAVFNPDYRTPRSWQMNLGFQHEFRPGTVLSVDYIRNIGEHNLLILDTNHSGAARSYNSVNAIAARDQAQTNAILYHGTKDCPAGIGQALCMINSFGGVAGAQAAYSAAGLDSNSATTGGGPCSFCAFPGITPTGINYAGGNIGNGSLGTLDTLSTIGRSVYAGWQAKLVQRVERPIRAVKTANFEVSYAYSKSLSQGQDVDFASVATNNDKPLQFTGPNGMDRKHMFSLGGTFDLLFLTKLSLVGHFYSPLPQNLQLPELTNGGEIYATDWLGSGLGSGAAPEPVPGTGIGQFMRGTNINNLPQVISTYNTHFAGNLTPAGHCLVADGGCPGAATIAVMTSSDMAALGWVMPTLPVVNPTAINMPWLKSFDVRVAWPIKIKDRITIEPSASVFNAFNFANAFLPGSLPIASVLSGPNPTAVPNGLLAPNVVGGVTGAGLTPFRAGFESGTYALGAPRQIEFGLRISF